ncbi:MAG TPA: hypothetical protein VFD58_35095 [Blastocatellia bacterium]|nr:hypothetical protein [Blastocatellia bacterium]
MKRTELHSSADQRNVSHQPASQRWVAQLKIALVALAVLAITQIFFFDSRLTPAATAHQEAGRRAERFDFLVREDFFAGMAGDQEKFRRALKLCEETLAKNPKHAEAMVWHGSGLLFMGGQSFQKGEMQKGAELWERGQKEMDAAIALEPDNVGVRIARGATYIQSSKYVPMPAQALAMLETGVGDYEKALELQKPYFDKLGVHARGELLWGLAEGSQRLGNKEKARGYAERMVKECAGSAYAERAKALLDNRKPASTTCTGCHAR